jgi:hypothetical protein
MKRAILLMPVLLATASALAGSPGSGRVRVKDAAWNHCAREQVRRESPPPFVLESAPAAATRTAAGWRTADGTRWTTNRAEIWTGPGGRRAMRDERGDWRVENRGRWRATPGGWIHSQGGPRVAVTSAGATVGTSRYTRVRGNLIRQP